MVLIGVDLGLTGALSVIHPDRWCAVKDLPIVGEDGDRRIDGAALLRAFQAAMDGGHAAMVIAEDVRPRPEGRKGGKTHGNSMHSQGSLMRSRGIFEAVCDIAGVKVVFVQPQTWKKFYGLIKKDKDASRLMAIELYPTLRPDLKFKYHQNRAESLLIAHWAKRKLL